MNNHDRDHYHHYTQVQNVSPSQEEEPQDIPGAVLRH